jgi:OOP family OmpA-OmpF porin
MDEARVEKPSIEGPPAAPARRRRLPALATLALTMTSAAAVAGVMVAVLPAPTPGATAAAAASAPAPYPEFRRALARDYAAFARDEFERYGIEFDRVRYLVKARAAEGGRVPVPELPAAHGAVGATLLALKEGRARLVRLVAGTGPERTPEMLARAQIDYECWLSRAAGRAGSDGVRDCAERFAEAIRAAEDALLPLPSPSAFARALAREYFAYADHKAHDESDFIAARYFAAKGLAAARAATGAAVAPEALSLWDLPLETALPELQVWHDRLVAALARHRESRLFTVAAIAQARFDCWVERAAKREAPGAIAKCRGEFLDAMRVLEGLVTGRSPAAAAADSSYAVAFDLRSSNIRRDAAAQVRAAARVALERNARSVSIVALPGGPAGDPRLALKRADAIGRELARLGVPADRIRAVYLADAPSPKAGAPEPAVEIVIE